MGKFRNVTFISEVKVRSCVVQLLVFFLDFEYKLALRDLLCKKLRNKFSRDSSEHLVLLLGRALIALSVSSHYLLLFDSRVNLGDNVSERLLRIRFHQFLGGAFLLLLLLHD